MPEQDESSTRRDLRVKIALPLPLDVTGTISNLISRAYPNSVIEPSSLDLVIRVTDADRLDPVRLTDEDIAESMLTTDDPENEGEFLAWEGNGFKTGTPESIGAPMVASLRVLFKENPDIINYLEMKFLDKDEPYGTYVVTACRSDKQTPHELRMIEKAKLDNIRALCEENPNAKIPASEILELLGEE